MGAIQYREIQADLGLLHSNFVFLYISIYVFICIALYILLHLTGGNLGGVVVLAKLSLVLVLVAKLSHANGDFHTNHQRDRAHPTNID